MLDKIFDLICTQRFADWYNDGGNFDTWIQEQGCDGAPTEEQVKAELAKMLGIKEENKKTSPEPLQPTIFNTLPTIVFRGVGGIEAFVCKDRETALAEVERLNQLEHIEVLGVTDATCQGNTE